MTEQKPQLDKFAIAAALQEIAQLMELRGGQSRFKAKAYNAGARSIQAVGDLDRLVRADQAALFDGRVVGPERSPQRVSSWHRTTLGGPRTQSRQNQTTARRARHQFRRGIESGRRGREVARPQRLWRKDRKTFARADRPVERETARAFAPASRVEHGR